MRKPAFCICNNKGAAGADELSGNRADDSHLCFSCKDSAITQFAKSKI